MTLQELVDSNRTLITRQEAAQLLQLKPNTLYVWSLKGWYRDELPVVYLSNRVVRYRLEDVQSFIARRTGQKVCDPEQSQAIAA